MGRAKGTSAMRGASRIGLLAVAGLVVLSALAGFGSRKGSARARLERTRRALRQEGFKLELAEFHFEISPQDCLRGSALDRAGLRFSQAGMMVEAVDWLPVGGTNGALVLWNQPEARTWGRRDLWGGLRELDGAALDQVESKMEGWTRAVHGQE